MKAAELSKQEQFKTIIVEIWKGGRWVFLGKWHITKTPLTVEEIARAICPNNRRLAPMETDGQGVSLIRIF